MRGLLIALLLAISLPMATAVADGRAFPPDNCSVTSPFMAFTAIDGSNTYCINGQSVLSNALPSCGADQVVAFNGSAFYCKLSEFDAPACAAGEFLTSDGEGFSCASTNVPTCAANYVLTYNGSSFTCVPKSADVPTCGANQFLTYNGTSFQCAATQSLTIPTCVAGQVLTGSDGTLTCVPGSGATLSCTEARLRPDGLQIVSGDASAIQQVTHPQSFHGLRCNTGWQKVYCGITAPEEDSDTINTANACFADDDEWDELGDPVWGQQPWVGLNVICCKIQ